MIKSRLTGASMALGITLLALLVSATAQATPAENEARTHWVYQTITRENVPLVLKRALSEQESINRDPDAALDLAHFACVAPNAPLPSAAAEAMFARAPTSIESHAADSYAAAAALGHWRAAARLTTLMMDDEDWEAARPVIAWLINEKVPSGYNKLADLLHATASYDGESPTSMIGSFVIGLRWRAAREGDPVAQKIMASLADKQEEHALAQALRTCATQNNPEL